MEKNKAKFIGVYEVKGRRAKDEVELAHDLPLYQEFKALCTYYYELEPCAGFEDLIDRVVIDWGSATRTWAQHLTEKEVIEVLPVGYVKDFPGFLELIIDYDELVGIINNPDGHRVWHTLLSSVGGIYLIIDRQTGQQYVGSAYGKQGIWGRWTEYARTGHGENKELRALLNTTPDYARNFRFTILQTLDKSLTRREVIEREEHYKKKLGSRAFGLNT